MKRKLVLGLILLFIVGCAAGQTTIKPTEQKVMTYEEVALSLATSQSILASYEAQGILQGGDLARAKQLYADSRASFIEAGNDMVLMIQAPSVDIRAQQMQLYAKALAKASQLAIQLAVIFKK